MTSFGASPSSKSDSNNRCLRSSIAVAKSCSAVVSFACNAARRFLNQVKLCALAESLGGVETLISLPALMTHASMPKEVQERIGISDGLVRLSVGIEDLEDITADLDQALLYV